MTTKQRKQVSTEPAAVTALLAEAARHGWRVQFFTDLAHDAKAIATMLPREPFAWCLRADGTHLARVIDTADRRSAVTPLTMRAVAHAFGADQCRFYVWDGAALTTMDDAQHADDRLADLANERYRVTSRRASSFVSAAFGSPRVAAETAIQWAKRYGEDFVVVDTWEDAESPPGIITT